MAEVESSATVRSRRPSQAIVRKLDCVQLLVFCFSALIVSKLLDEQALRLTDGLLTSLNAMGTNTSAALSLVNRKYDSTESTSGSSDTAHGPDKDANARDFTDPNSGIPNAGETAVEAEALAQDVNKATRSLTDGMAPAKPSAQGADIAPCPTGAKLSFYRL
jgi:hypothetical protein